MCQYISLLKLKDADLVDSSICSINISSGKGAGVSGVTLVHIHENTKCFVLRCISELRFTLLIAILKGSF